jgi:hypothetical protein
MARLGMILPIIQACVMAVTTTINGLVSVPEIGSWQRPVNGYPRQAACRSRGTSK